MTELDPIREAQANITRRAFFHRSALGIGTAALSAMLPRGLSARQDPGLPHFAPKAKRVIYLFQNGGPAHVDLFDWKPKLKELHGKEMPLDSASEARFSAMLDGQNERLCMGEYANFARHGESGATVSGLMPEIAKIADKLCFVKSMHTTQVNHAPAITFFLTGGEQPGRPSMGSWLSYGLGRDTDDLPTFVVMTSRDQENSCGQIFYDYYWGSGFLPSVHQGVNFRGQGDPVLYLRDPAGLDRSTRRGMLDDLMALNEKRAAEIGDPEIQTRIAQYEMAYRMQASVPEVTDFSSEPEHVLEMYGPDVHRKGSFAYNCLMARRLIERGTRFVQCMHAGWDQHRNWNTQLSIQCRDTDAPSAALIKDLEQRGLLDDTLVIWGGEFGRTPFCQGVFGADNQGRDHHPYGFTIWMAGGGIKPGTSYGATDDFGFHAVENRVHVHDFQATVLHLLGIDHERLTYRFQGRRFRLTDVHGQVVKDILA
ncbi:MAG: DUF1501 domain-containing protein [Planctomycetes bacterium]|nr:DUF1501 domain-containing protein [Planctomycetota bacterium]